MKTGSILFGIIGTVAISFAVTNIRNLKTNITIDESKETKIAIKEEPKIKREELYGIYVVKNDKNTKLSLNNDGTYSLTINVCDNYISLNGAYEIRDTKLKLYNRNFDYDDLLENNELSFELIDKGKIKSEESLICTPQGTLFEK